MGRLTAFDTTAIQIEMVRGHQSRKWRANISKGLIGRKSTANAATYARVARIRWQHGCMPDSHKKAIGLAAAKRIANWDWSKVTDLEKALYLLLGEFSFVRQYRIGTKVVDAWLPDEHIAFEADGSYWHQDSECQDRRDAYLMQRGVLAVIHLRSEDLIW